MISKTIGFFGVHNIFRQTHFLGKSKEKQESDREISSVAAGGEQRNEPRDDGSLWPEAEAGRTSISRGGWEDGILLSWLILL